MILLPIQAIDQQGRTVWHLRPQGFPTLYELASMIQRQRADQPKYIRRQRRAGLFVHPELRISRPEQDAAQMEEFLVEGGRAFIAAEHIEGRIPALHPGFYSLHELA